MTRSDLGAKRLPFPTRPGKILPNKFDVAIHALPSHLQTKLRISLNVNVMKPEWHSARLASSSLLLQVVRLRLAALPVLFSPALLANAVALVSAYSPLLL